jgi:hypothetical protein
MHAQPIPALTAARWLAGPIVWGAHFLIVYASESVICTRGGGASMHLMLLGAVTAAGVLVLLATTAHSWRTASAPASSAEPGSVFMEKTAVALGLLGMLALLWTALPAALVPACLPPA